MNHKGTQRIETERLCLRAFVLQDAEAMYHNWASDYEVTRFLTWPVHENVEASGKILEDWRQKGSDKEFYQWAIVLKTAGEAIGSISAVKVDNDTESVTIGYCIGKRWWGQGITAEALRAVIKFFFEETGAHCINACHDPRNPNSGKVMRKCGMTYEGTWRAGGINNQGICDESWYSVLKEEYDRRKSIPGYDIWNILYEKAAGVQRERTVSPFVDAGGVAAAVLTRAGNVYVGVCIDTASGLGMCGERNAIANMLTNGEYQIDKVAAIMPDGKAGPPCGACQEFMMQLDRNSGEIEILLDLDTRKTVRLKELMPDWWGRRRFDAAQ